jgi:hypothetical protein
VPEAENQPKPDQHQIDPGPFEELDYLEGGRTEGAIA